MKKISIKIKSITLYEVKNHIIKENDNNPKNL